MLPLDIIFNFKKLRKKVKNVLKKIEPDLVHVHGTETGFATVAQSIAYLKILSIQGVLTEVLKHENTFKFKLLAGLEKNIIKSFVNFACRTNYDKDFVIKYNQLANVIKLEEAVNPIYFQTNWVFNKNKTLLYIGGIIDRKGIYTLLDTLDELNKEGNNYFLKIIGGGSTQSIKKMNSIINNYNLRESVEYLGVLKPEQISLLFSQSNMYVCSSKIENSPNSVCEAMAVGIPVVAFNVGGLASLINNGEDGFLVTNYNTSELKSCILKVNSLSQSQLLKVSCAAKERAILRNQPDRVAENYYKEYLQLLGHSK
ncbi:MAG TPA: glycosyltransferase family 4 protein [Ignavibacteriaceae bacterium]|nr:glycosyltransferase family 4 protein [Ignavibacteriaceae bacterium]